MFLQGNVGQPNNASMSPGVPFTLRGGQMGDLIVSELQGRFYENAYRGNLFSTGTATLLNINNVTFAIATLGATCTPIVGVWNPSTSTSNLVILQATLAITATAATSTGAGPFYWASSVGNTAITLGTAGLNRKTLVASGGQGQGFFGSALTGQTTALTVKFGSALGSGPGLGYSNVGTAAGAVTMLQGSVENFDGALIVPPGGLLALLAANTPVACSAASSMLYAEVPL